MNSIDANERKLHDVFSEKYHFIIPAYQRPYSWTPDQAIILFEDLYDSFCKFKEEGGLGKSSRCYFLGSIVLIKGDTPDSQVIDGQQRLTTLTILLSVISSIIPNKNDAATFFKYICEEGNRYAGIDSKPRLKLRDKDNSFFKEYIQEYGNIERLIQLDPQLFSEPQANIINNAKAFYNILSSLSLDPDALFNFNSFISQNCYLVVVTTPDQESAFKIFSTMNNRGMDLQATDIIKADIIGSIEENKRQDYTDKWENIELSLGREGFNDLFSQIRMIKQKNKAQESLQVEFKKFVLPSIDDTKAREFIDKVLEPYSDAYSIIKKSRYESVEKSEEVNSLLKWLNRLDNSDWIPCALVFFINHKNSPDDLIGFFKKLERLAAYLRTVSSSINERIKRYSAVLSELEETNCFSKIDLLEGEQKEFLAQLNSDIYTMTPIKRKYLIIRLDSFLSDGIAKYDYDKITIEHVLPQTVTKGSEWDRVWEKEEDRKMWLNKIGNLIPLSRQKNSQAQNYEFKKKKEKYFSTNNGGVSSFALATQVLQEEEWTPSIVKERQKELITAYKKGWELN